MNCSHYHSFDPQANIKEAKETAEFCAIAGFIMVPLGILAQIALFIEQLPNPFQEPSFWFMTVLLAAAITIPGGIFLYLAFAKGPQWVAAAKRRDQAHQQHRIGRAGGI